MTTSERYTPGICNLGRQERTVRLLMGTVGAIVTVGFAIWLITTDSPLWQRVLIFFPAFVGALGLLQARQHFCVAYGFLGVFNAGFGAGQVAKIEDQTQRNQDRMTAIKLIVQSVSVSVLVSLIVSLWR